MMFLYPGMISIKSNAVGRVDYRTAPRTGVAARIDRSTLTTSSAPILEVFQLWSNEVVGQRAGPPLIERPANPSFPSFSPKLTVLPEADMENEWWCLDTLPDGKFGAVCYFRDISQRVQADDMRQLLVNELSHRVKNKLASVQAIAQQTLRHTKSPSDLVLRFTGRIQSLARVHSLLTESTWPGTDLRSRIRDQLLQGAADQTTPGGPDVHLGAQTANRWQAAHPGRPEACGEPRP
jgi:HWE histidine kinase